MEMRPKLPTGPAIVSNKNANKEDTVFVQSVIFVSKVHISYVLIWFFWSLRAAEGTQSERIEVVICLPAAYCIQYYKNSPGPGYKNFVDKGNQLPDQ